MITIFLKCTTSAICSLYGLRCCAEHLGISRFIISRFLAVEAVTNGKHSYFYYGDHIFILFPFPGSNLPSHFFLCRHFPNFASTFPVTKPYVVCVSKRDLQYFVESFPLLRSYFARISAETWLIFCMAILEMLIFSLW